MKQNPNSQRNRAVGWSDWLDVLRRITLWFHPAFDSRLRAPSRRRSGLLEFFDVLAQLGVLRFKLFIATIKFRHLLFENRKLLAEKRDMLALNGCGTVLGDELFDRGEDVGDFHTSNEKEVSYRHPGRAVLEVKGS